MSDCRFKVTRKRRNTTKSTWIKSDTNFHQYIIYHGEIWVFFQPHMLFSMRFLSCFLAKWSSEIKSWETLTCFLFPINDCYRQTFRPVRKPWQEPCSLLTPVLNGWPDIQFSLLCCKIVDESSSNIFSGKPASRIGSC